MAFLAFILASNVPEDTFVLSWNPGTLPEPNFGRLVFSVPTFFLLPNFGGLNCCCLGAPAVPERPVQVGVPISTNLLWRLDSFKAAAALSAIIVAKFVKYM